MIILGVKIKYWDLRLPTSIKLSYKDVLARYMLSSNVFISDLRVPFVGKILAVCGATWHILDLGNRFATSRVSDRPFYFLDVIGQVVSKLLAFLKPALDLHLFIHISFVTNTVRQFGMNLPFLTP